MVGILLWIFIFLNSLNDEYFPFMYKLGLFSIWTLSWTFDFDYEINFLSHAFHEYDISQVWLPKHWRAALERVALTSALPKVGARQERHSFYLKRGRVERHSIFLVLRNLSDFWLFNSKSAKIEPNFSFFEITQSGLRF